MKKLIWVPFLLCLILAPCEGYNEARIMPGFNNSETEVTLYKNIGSQATIVINTTADDITAEYDANWLSVDINKRRVTHTIMATNETGEPRTAVMKLVSGERIQEMTVAQYELGESGIKLLKVGNLMEGDLGMISWVDPESPEVGKVISLQCRVGACELPYKMNGTFSIANGIENTVLFVNPSPNDAVVFCTSTGDRWYTPASEELADLSNAYNGIVHNDPTFVANNTEVIADTERAARVKFEKMSADLGGDLINSAAMGAGKSYWLSAEVSTVVDGKNAICVRFGKYLSQGSSKEGSARYARTTKLAGNYKFPEEPATLKISSSKVDLTSEEGTSEEVTVTTNKDTCTYVIEGEDVAWIKAEQNGDVITFTVFSANASNKERSVTITFTTGSEDDQAMMEVIVTQEEMPVTLALTTGEYVDMGKRVQLAEGGIVFWAGGNEAKILVLKRIEPTDRLLSDADAAFVGIVLGLDKDSGEKNIQKMRGCGFSGRISVLQYCQDGRYLPAVNKMDEVFKAYNGGAEVDNAVITPEEQTARASWEQILATHSGDMMNIKEGVGDEYITSSESADVTKIFLVCLGKWEPGEPGVKMIKRPARYMRLIRKVSK